MSTQVKNKEAFVYSIPFSRSDRRSLKNTGVSLRYVNARDEYSAGLHYCSLILKVDFGVEVTNYFFNDHGKPFLLSDKYGLSVSYTDDRVYVAIAAVKVGFDAEKIADIDLGVSQTFMSENEQRRLVEAMNKLEYFYRSWTLKESYLKLIGTGIDDTIATVEPIEYERGKYHLSEKGEKSAYFNHSVTNDVAFSLCSYVLLDYKFIEFNSKKKFLKKYGNNNS